MFSRSWSAVLSISGTHCPHGVNMSKHQNLHCLAAAAACAALLSTSQPAFAQSQYAAIDLSYSGNYGSAVEGMSGGQGGGHVIYDVYYVDHVKHYKLHA